MTIKTDVYQIRQLVMSIENRVQDINNEPRASDKHLRDIEHSAACIREILGPSEEDNMHVTIHVEEEGGLLAKLRELIGLRT